jgi:nicotinate-nucleotide pyrophosphorylase
MQNAAVGTSALAEGQHDNHSSVVASLKSLIEQVQASIALVETAIATEFAAEFCDGNREAAADIFVLDDVTPPYEQAHAALKASDTGLGAALQFILDANRSGSERC